MRAEGEGGGCNGLDRLRPGSGSGFGVLLSRLMVRGEW